MNEPKSDWPPGSHNAMRDEVSGVHESSGVALAITLVIAAVIIGCGLFDLFNQVGA